MDMNILLTVEVNKVVKVVLLDGYVDEPTCLGVPPYISPYIRYTAGAIWTANPQAQIRYFTIDEVRKNVESFYKVAEDSDLFIVVFGVSVPGKYLGGKPATPREIYELALKVKKPVKVVGGPAAKFGSGVRGGMVVRNTGLFEEVFDLIVTGDLEIVIHDLILEKLKVNRVDPTRIRESAHSIFEYAVKGARVVTQHPRYPRVICEIETYRGCSRKITGGCSFCTTAAYYGLPDFRPVKDIVSEIEALYRHGVKYFRLGNQPDLFAYQAKGVGELEFPKPIPEAIKKLYQGIRNVAPNCYLWMDNVNPGTIAHYPEESREIAKIIVTYNTPGDVAAFGVESADPKVIKLNNLKCTPEETMKAIEILNEIGRERGWNGLPKLLPGLNFVFGLIGETEKTYELNYLFLKEILEKGLLVRRINLRQVLVFPGTRMWKIGTKILRKNYHLFKKWSKRIRDEIDIPMLKKVVPAGTVLKEVITETYFGKRTYARQLGTYPITTVIPDELPLNTMLDVKVIDHQARSVIAIPYPLDINKASIRILSAIPQIGKKRAARILKNRPIKNQKHLETILDNKTLAKQIYQNYIAKK